MKVLGLLNLAMQLFVKQAKTLPWLVGLNLQTIV